MARMNIEQALQDELRQANQTRYYDKWNAAMGLMAEMREAQKAQADNIIDALGLRDAYPNTRVEETSHLPGVTAIQSTVFGRDVFLDDVNLAAPSVKGNAAVDRIAAALKTRSTK